MKKPHNEKGIWSQAAAEAYHQSSPKLAAWLAGYLPKEVPVIDFGCGKGFYIYELQKQGFETSGVEGTRLTNTIMPPAFIFILDLTEPITIYEDKTCSRLSSCSVLSLEVGEHLPASAQETFMQTLVNHCSKHLILSWAEIGQPGIGHINCRSQEDVIQDVETRGFKLNREATADARANIDDNCDWFRRTLLVFERI